MEQNLKDQGLEFEKMELYAKLDDEKNQFFISSDNDGIYSIYFDKFW